MSDVPFTRSSVPAGKRILVRFSTWRWTGSPILERNVLEWSPSGSHVKLAARFGDDVEWVCASECTLVEVLA